MARPFEQASSTAISRKRSPKASRAVTRKKKLVDPPVRRPDFEGDEEAIFQTLYADPHEVTTPKHPLLASPNLKEEDDDKPEDEEASDDEDFDEDSIDDEEEETETLMRL